MGENITFKEIPKYGKLMSLSSFIEDVKDGLFIDYDGFGYYTKDNKMSNILIKPSHVENKKLVEGFNSIVWFNR